MAWLRIDDGFTKHPKFEGWTTAQKWAFLELMEYCARYRTEGRVLSDLSLLPRSITPKILMLAEASGWIDRDPENTLWIHDWSTYNPKDPTKANRQRRWRNNQSVDGHVDGHVDTVVDADVDTHSVYGDGPSRAGTRARTRPVPSPEEQNPAPAPAPEARPQARANGAGAGADEHDREDTPTQPRWQTDADIHRLEFTP